MGLAVAERADMEIDGERIQADTGTPDYSRKDKLRFTKMYAKGLHTLADLAGSKSTLRVYLFIVENCGIENALVASQDMIAEELGISSRTVRRATLDLEAQGHIVIDKIAHANVYILNDGEFWKTYEDHKRFSSFRAQTLVPKGKRNLKKRLTHMLGEP